jgi:hypothetical protein
MLDITNHINRMINLVDRETWSNIVDSGKSTNFYMHHYIKNSRVIILLETKD